MSFCVRLEKPKPAMTEVFYCCLRCAEGMMNAWLTIDICCEDEGKAVLSVSKVFDRKCEQCGRGK